MRKMGLGNLWEKRWRPVWIYAFLSVLAVFAGMLGQLYGCEDPSVMKNIYLYPLAAGTGGYLVIRLLASHAAESEYYRLFSWFYNAGIAVLFLEQFLSGWFGETGRVRAYLRMIFIAGWTLLAVGILVLIIAEKESVKGV